MAHKKAGGSTNNGRDSNPNMYGVKKYGGETVKPGQIIVTQAGSKFHGGNGTGTGKNFTIYAKKEGKVQFSYYTKKKQYVSVI
ncbi:MAG: 50S ribosomal protein L27 [Bacteriovoracaceae bacterium]